MKNLKALLFLFISIFTLINCSDDDTKYTEVKIRISNISTFNYENITVNSKTFENVNSGDNTEYKIFESAYRYGFIELDIDGSTFTIQPIDYVGEILLKPGNYTYQIDANDSAEQYGKLSLVFVED